MMRVAVVGANGFIGSRAVELLHLEGLAAVRPVVRNLSRLARAARFDLDWRVADARDRAALTDALKDCEVVVHAVAGDRNTILGTLAPVYAAAETAGVRRLVYLSSAAVHGQDPAPGTDEESALSNSQPLPYNAHKIRAERALGDLRRRGRVEVVILRPGIVYGPRSRWTAAFADDLVAGRAYVVDGGAGICNGVYVDNLVRAIQLALDAPGADGEAFLVGDAEQYTWADLYRPIAAALGFGLDAVPSVAYAEGRVDWWDRFEAARQTSAARRVLSLVPMRLRAAAYAAVDAWRANGRAAPDGWTTAGPPAPRATREMALLQRSRWKLPSAKAARVLGYRPSVAFDEACRRSIGWLEFAGYPVRASFAADRGRASTAARDALGTAAGAERP